MICFQLDVEYEFDKRIYYILYVVYSFFYFIWEVEKCGRMKIKKENMIGKK